MNGLTTLDLKLFLPEFILGASILALFVGDLLVHNPAKKRRYLTWLALGGVGAALYASVSLQAQAPTSIFFGQLAIDPIGFMFKMLFAAITAVAILTSLLSKELPDRHMGEYYALLLSITFGMHLMVSANDLLMAYLGIEMVSIVSYAMAGYRLHDRRSSEAALKYVVYGGAASGMMFFGISLFYGMFGTTEFSALNGAIAQWGAEFFNTGILESGTPAAPMALLVSLVLIFAGIGYKIAVVPFHMWSPDVYEGAPTPFSGFLSVGPKAAGFAILMRVFLGVLAIPGQGELGFASDDAGLLSLSIDLPLPAMLGVVAAATMTFGNLAALPQTNVKRLLAYSSIAHAGYLLMGFVVLSEASLHAVAFYLVIYYLMNIGAFAVCQIVRDETGGEMLQDFRGFGQQSPIIGIFMTLFLLSLTGLPPLAGFIGKFYLFSSVIAHGGFWYVMLAIIGVLNSAVSLYYYMKVIKAMWIASPVGDRAVRVRPAYVALTSVLAVPTLVFGLAWESLSTEIRSSMAFFSKGRREATTASVHPPSIPTKREP